MGFSGGSSNNSSSSYGYGYNQSLAQSLNAQQSNQNVWGAQAPALGNMYGQAQALAGKQAGAGAASQALVDRNMGAVNQGIGAMGKIAGGGGPLAAYAQPNNALARQQLDAASAAIGENFQRNIIPGITSAAGQVGGIGGSREALARGVAAGDASNAIARAATDIYSQQYGIGAQAAAGQTDAMLTAASAMPGAATSAVNLGMSPYAAAWAPLQSMAQILGGPTVLGQSSGMGISQAASLGEDWRSQKSSGKSSQWGFNLF